MLKRKRLLEMAVVVMCLFLLPAMALAGPQDQIRQMVDSVIGIVQDKAIGDKAKEDRIASLVKERFDFKGMARRALGKNWRKADSGQREKFTGLFADLLEATYSGRIISYSGERVKYTRERIKGNRAIIDTFIVSGNKDIPVIYRMVKSSGGWFVVDVVIEEVSLIRNFRDTYSEIIANEGFTGLFDRMARKIKELKISSDGGVAQ